MDASSVPDRLELPSLDGLSGVWVVGGAVRDTLLGVAPRDVDLVSESGGPSVAAELASRLGVAAPVVHGRFGTATVDGINVATARAESYPRPGALPEVRAGSLEEDMARRDFTVNAIAVGASPDVRGRVVSAPGAFDDLSARSLRVLHDASFVDDPTRLFRLARYAARLGFAVDERTASLAREAFAADAPATAGRARMGSELLLMLREGEPVPALLALRSLAGEASIDPGLVIDEEVLRGVVALLPRDALALLAALSLRVPRERLRSWLDDAHVVGAAAVLDATAAPGELARAMREAAKPSDLWRLLRRRPVQAVAVAGALGAEEPARRWLDELRDVRLSITGEYLLRAGVPQGPEVGRRLNAALVRKLDEGLASRDEELAAALS